MAELNVVAYSQALIAYNEWSNNKILSAAESLLDEQFDRAFGASYESIRGNLLHILLAQTIWITRINRDRAVPSVPEFRGDIAPAFEVSHYELHELGLGLTEDRWRSVLEYTDSRGDDHALPIGQIIGHVVNHGTYHRGEIALMLTQLGNSPGDLDYVYFLLGIR